MKKIIIEASIIITAISAAAFAFNRINSLKEENIRLKNNQDILLTEKKSIISESQKYKVSDSLNAIKASRLELTLKEYKQYRNEDLKLIGQLKIKKSDLSGIITSQHETIINLSARLQDTIKIDNVTNQKDTLKHFSYKSKWTDIEGYIDLKRDTAKLQIKNKESLKVVETVIYKRFLGFLWKTNKVKSRQVDVISENPNTKIIGCEYISIKR